MAVRQKGAPRLASVSKPGKPRSAKAMQADLHRQEIRHYIDSLAKREKEVWKTNSLTPDEQHRKLCEFAGAAGFAVEQIGKHLDSLDKLAGWPAGQTKTALDSASKA